MIDDQRPAPVKAGEKGISIVEDDRDLIEVLVALFSYETEYDVAVKAVPGKGWASYFLRTRRPGRGKPCRVTRFPCAHATSCVTIAAICGGAF
jgi:hypothetical protein